MGWGILGGEDVEFRSGNATIQAHIGRPAAPGRYPAIITLHGINGPSAGTHRAAERYGDHGIVGCAINWQTVDKDPADSELMQYIADAAAFLRRQEYCDGDRIAVAGYCRGGGLVYLALEHHPWLRAGIAMHGFPFYRTPLNEKKPQHAYDLADRIQAPLLILHGAADDRAPVEDVYRMAQRLEELGKTFVLTVYSGTGHAFTLPDGGAYNPDAAANAWDQSIAFLDRYLRV
jgi:carboxymethylenebutenolidase